VILSLIPGIMLAGATFVVRKVELSSAGIVARYYFGRKVALTWQEVMAAELFTVQSPEAVTQIVRVKSHRGRKVAFNSNLSNFGRLLANVEINSPTGIVRQPPRQKGPLEL